MRFCHCFLSSGTTTLRFLGQIVDLDVQFLHAHAYNKDIYMADAKKIYFFLHFQNEAENGIFNKSNKLALSA